MSFINVLDVLYHYAQLVEDGTLRGSVPFDLSQLAFLFVRISGI